MYKYVVSGHGRGWLIDLYVFLIIMFFRPSCSRLRLQVGGGELLRQRRLALVLDHQSSELMGVVGAIAAFVTQCNWWPFWLILRLPPPRAAACPCGRRGLRAGQQPVLSVGSLL